MSTNNDDQLETQFGDLIAWLEASRPANRPVPAEFKSQVRNRILNYRPIQRRRLVPVSLALAVAVLVVGVFLWAVSPRPVSAAEIISRASQVATSGSAVLRSYTGIEVVWFRLRYSSDNPSVDSPLEPSTEIYTWAKLPNLVRQEWRSFLSSPMPAQTATSIVGTMTAEPKADVDLSKVPSAGVQTSLVINDGSTVSMQDPYAKTITLYSPEATQIQPLSNSYKSLLRQFEAQNYSVKLIGTETIAGRDAYMLTFIPKPDQHVSVDTAQIKLWIDTQTYFPLQQKALDKDGVVLGGWAYLQFSPNIDIPAERFAFQPDPEFTIIDLRTPKDAAALNLAWRIVASKAVFKVFRPTNVPASLIMECPFYYPDKGGDYGDMQQRFYSPDSVPSIELIVPPALSIMEVEGVSVGPMYGVAIKIDEDDGDYYEDNGFRTLRFVHNGTLIILESNQQVMSKEELLDLARNMQLVPKA